MLQNMIMSVCVGCVYIVTTKCRAMRQNHLDESSDQEMIRFLYIFLFYIVYHQDQQQQKRTTEKLHLRNNGQK